MVIMEVMGLKFLDIMLVIAHIHQYISASLLHDLYINATTLKIQDVCMRYIGRLALYRFDK
jgi:hypothetical protein